MGYHLIEAIGDEAFIRGYVEGWFSGRGLDVEGVHFGSDHGMEHEGFLTKLEQLFGLKVEKNLLIISDALLSEFDQALGRLPEPRKMTIGARRVLAGIRFPFQVTVYNRQLADDIDALLVGPAGGARIDDFERHSRDDADGSEGQRKEVGAYAPEHDYRYDAKGVITGDIACALKLDRSLAAYENVRFSNPELQIED